MACIKYIVILYNLIFWFVGVFMLGISAYLYWDSQNYLNFSEISEFYITPFVLLLVLGFFMTIVGFFGCCGAIRESRCLLSLYFLFCLSMCIATGAFLFLAFNNRNLISERIKLDITKAVKQNYGSGKSNATETFIDSLQRNLDCCGVNGPEDWITANLNQLQGNQSFKNPYDLGTGSGIPSSISQNSGTYRIPESCCEEPEESTESYDARGQGGFSQNFRKPSSCENRVAQLRKNQDQLASIQGLNQVGCVRKLEELATSKWWVILLAFIGIFAIHIFALLTACLLCCAITREEDK